MGSLAYREVEETQGFMQIRVIRLDLVCKFACKFRRFKQRQFSMSCPYLDRYRMPLNPALYRTADTVWVKIRGPLRCRTDASKSGMPQPISNGANSRRRL